MSQLLQPNNPIEPGDVPDPGGPNPDSVPDAVPPAQPAAFSGGVDDGFDYHPMPVLVPVAFVIALLGLTGLVGVFGIIMAAIAVPIAAWALLKIRASEGFYSGRGLARAALALGLFGVIGGVVSQRIAYKNEVPAGFDRVSFKYDISEKPVEESNLGMRVSSDVKQLEGKPIFVKGYMYPQRQTEGLKTFLLLKDTGECCFGGDPAVTDMIGIKLKGTEASHHEQQLVSVAGTFRINPNYGNWSRDGSPEPLYMLDATHFELSRTRF